MVDGFSAGPLSIHGVGNASHPAVLDFTFSPLAQHFSVDGEITLFGAKSSILLNADLLPKPRFNFNSSFSFDDAFEVNFTANMIGEINLASVASLGTSDLDFRVTADMNQHLLSHLADMVSHQLDIYTNQSMFTGIHSMNAVINLYI